MLPKPESVRRVMPALSCGLALGLVIGVGLGALLFHGPVAGPAMAQAMSAKGQARRELLTFDGVAPDVKERAVEQLRAQDVIDEENGEVYFNVDKAIDQLERKEQADQADLSDEQQEGVGPAAGAEDSSSN